MRNLRLFALFIVAFVSCKTTPGDNSDSYQLSKTDQDELMEVIEKELETGERYDTVFLGYRLGMSKQQVEKWTKSLILTDKLKTDRATNRVYAELMFDDISAEDVVEATVDIELHNDTLYKFIVSCKSKSALFPSPELLFYKMYTPYIKKYGVPVESDNHFKGTPKLTWVHGNRKIEMIEGFDDVRVFYIDLPTEILIESQKEKQNKALLDSTIDDI